MTYTILFFATRKAGTTPEQFREHYETKHMPLFRELAGEHVHLKHTTRYIQRTQGHAEGTTRNATTPAQVIQGTQADFDYDAIAEITHKDAAAFQAMAEHIHAPERWAKIVEDEERFLDRAQSKVVVVGEHVSVFTKE
ncbi:EthD domain-containing protein [Hypoxylon fragiforme]|uniref:EthD domain-containing protein n=1 Tax=Hypoxylon fragiforme TaxID=63214 RepID=UPI0020C61AC2|nr:EthD domain-containing protein [Hypoxylon fragiforme]KAI2611762.1 EthD domain-containing protein [Hypoxylon fragiforme]